MFVVESAPIWRYSPCPMHCPKAKKHSWSSDLHSPLKDSYPSIFRVLKAGWWVTKSGGTWDSSSSWRTKSVWSSKRARNLHNFELHLRKVCRAIITVARFVRTSALPWKLNQSPPTSLQSLWEAGGFSKRAKCHWVCRRLPLLGRKPLDFFKIRRVNSCSP